ncbi:MAG: hypothetical protein FJZ13_04950 [Candidatus Omnitrophica bacterium]|nr:hypothetical protein [Candidatus Omnitrophota bacterium]
MIFPASFKKSILISLLGHIVVFGIFSLSFGDKIPALNYSVIFSWGAILRSSDLIAKESFRIEGIKEIFSRKSDAVPLYKDKAKIDYPLISNYYQKPRADLSFDKAKSIFMAQVSVLPALTSRKSQVIMFYPSLPYHFLLYFKDRQIAHIELAFSINPAENKNYIMIKRRISSGNLEADLLAIRYVSHYLFIQQANFPSDNWQKVKIELSPKDGI